MTATSYDHPDPRPSAVDLTHAGYRALCLDVAHATPHAVLKWEAIRLDLMSERNPQ